jgi:lipoprotein signal peptidase
MTRESKGKLGPGATMPALLAAVVIVDQTTKWWGWRHVSAATINSGGDALVGHAIGGWFADPATGALLDLLSCALLSIASLVLLRRRRSFAVLVTGSLLIGGWTSNLLDRLVLHYWTAPGSMRGAVDFLQFGDHYYNVADVVIVTATPLFLLSLTADGLRRFLAARPSRHGSVAPTMLSRQRLHRQTLHAQPLQPRRNRVRVAVLAGAVGLSVVVGMGAANDSGATTPATASAPPY